MTVRSRLLLALGGIILLMALPAAYAVIQLQTLRELAEDLERVHAEDILMLGNLRASLAELDRLQRSHVAAPDPAFRDAMQREFLMARNSLTVLAQSGYQEAADRTARMLARLQEANRQLDEMLGAGERAAATEYLEEVRPLLDSARVSLIDIGTALEERGQRAVEQAQRTSSSAVRTASLTTLIALLLTLGLGFWTVDALSRPLRRLSDATGRVAGGDFVAPENLPYDRTDEIGHLSRSFGAMTGKLAEADRMKSEFVSLATHELKTPINVIAGYAELLDEGLYGELDPRQREVVGLIQGQTHALTRLVNQLLDLSRLEAGGLRIEPAPVDFGRLLKEVEQSFRPLAVQKQIDFSVDTDPSLPSRIVIDHDRIRHEVLGNLLSNAFKFTESGGSVRLRSWAADGNVLIQVRDTGVGIPEDQVEKIFEKYYQVGRKAKAQGSGLGLAIAKHVVDAHGGTISASSSVGAGTTFDITLPAAGPGRG